MKITIYKNAIWSFTQDRPLSAEHEGSVAVVDSEPDIDCLLRLFRDNDRVVTPTTVHDLDGEYCRQSGLSH